MKKVQTSYGFLIKLIVWPDFVIKYVKVRTIRFAQLGIKDPNSTKRKRKYRTVATVIIGGSTKRINQLAFGDQKIDFTKGADNSHVTRCSDIENWAKDMYAFACEPWGEENIVGFYVHLDETWVHIHCSVVPITVDGRLNFNELVYRLW